jgi:hypothetical protein
MLRTALTILILSSVAFGQATADSPFQVRYAANLNVNDSFIDITNTGANGAALLGPGFGGAVGNICVNVYAFSPDEQEISCCSCLVTPNGLKSLSVKKDIISNTLTGDVPNSVVVKLLSTLAGAGGSGTSCTNSAATVTTATIAPGMAAWMTTTHQSTTTTTTVTPSPFFFLPPTTTTSTSTTTFQTETPFTPSTLSAGELASIGGRCATILANGSGTGICRSCQLGGQ